MCTSGRLKNPTKYHIPLLPFGKLANASVQFNFSYYLIASSNDSISDSSDDGWSKIFTSLTSFAKWAEAKAKIARVFGSYAQGLSIVEAVEKAVVPDESRAKKVNKCDLVKNELVGLFHGMFSKFTTAYLVSSYILFPNHL